MEATIYIEGEIVAQWPVDDNGWNLPGSFTTLAMVREQLDWRRPYDSLKVIINSPGGELTEGFAIYDLLVTQTVPVTTVALGQCSSIATAIFLAGAVRQIHEHTEFHVHLPAGGVIGTAADVAAYAEQIGRAQQQLIDCYVSRAGVAAEVITPLMAAETTLPVTQVRELGFATAIIQPVTALAKIARAPSAPKPAPAPDSSFMLTLKQRADAAILAIKALVSSPIKALAVTTSAGAALNIETGDRAAYEVGDAVTDADGNAVADGDVTLTDGTMLTIADGKIATITAPTSANADKGDETSTLILEAITALSGKVTALSGEVATMKAAASATKAEVAAITAKHDALAGSVGSGGKVPPVNDSDNTAGDPAAAAAAARAERRKGTQPRTVVV